MIRLLEVFVVIYAISQGVIIYYRGGPIFLAGYILILAVIISFIWKDLKP